jgi:hypothetical protein
MAHRTGVGYAAQALRRVAKLEHAEAMQVFPMWNLVATTRTTLAEGVELLPLSDLPDSPYKLALASLNPSALRGIWSFRELAKYGVPKCAVVARQTIRPLFRATGDIDEDSARTAKYVETVRDLELLLSAHAARPILSMLNWSQFSDPDVNDLSMQWVAQPHLEFTPPLNIFRDSHGVLNGALASADYTRFSSLPDGLRADLRRSLQRLRNSMLRMNVGDQAVELSIGLESVLVPDPGEHRYKIGLRCALLIGDTMQRRMEIRDVVDGLYIVRGATAHDSEKRRGIRVLGVKTDASQMIKLATPICSEVILRVLRDVPIKWTELELNPPRLPIEGLASEITDRDTERE